jgi:GAF domain-containing protein/HAMP domain-containing protein
MRNSIRWRLTMAFTSLVVLPLLLVGVVVAWRSINVEPQRALALEGEVARRVSVQVQAFIQELENSLRMVIQVRGLQTLDRDQQRAVLEELLYSQNAFGELILLDGQGQERIRLARLKVITEADLRDRSGADEFTIPKTSGATYYGPVRFDETTNEPRMTVALPIFGLRSGEVDAVLVAELRFRTVWDLIGEIRLDEGENVYIVDAQSQVVAHLNPAVVLQGTHFDPPDQDAITSGLEGVTSALATHEIRFGEQAFIVVAERDVTAALRVPGVTLIIIAAVILGSMVIAVSAGFLTARRIVRPIEALAATAQMIGDGDLTQEAEVSTNDEIGALARIFNGMTVQLRSLIGGLEQRVADRTRELEDMAETLVARGEELENTLAELRNREIELEDAVRLQEEARRRQEVINRELQVANEATRRRSAQLQATADVSRAIAQLRDPDDLLRRVTHLISQHFGFYHVGIFLIDDAGRNAVLRAANSEEGQRMLARGHRLSVGGQGIVGYVTDTGRPRIALDVGADAVYFDNPDLPETRSEMALPLRRGTEVIGALDVQSIAANAFDEQDAAVLQTLADQVSTALENAWLFARTEAALAEADAIHQQFLRQEWTRYIQQASAPRHEYLLSGWESLAGQPLPAGDAALEKGTMVALSGDADSGGAALAVPIKLRDQVIGVLDLQEADGERHWSEGEIALAQAVAERMAQAIESARLFEQMQMRARRERLTSQITARIRAMSSVQDMLRVTSEELGKALDVDRSVVRLRPQSDTEEVMA